MDISSIELEENSNLNLTKSQDSAECKTCKIAVNNQIETKIKQTKDKIILPVNKIYLSYIILFFSSIASNMTLSSFPAIIKNLKNDLNIDGESTLGLLTTINYLGQLFGSLIIMFMINYDIIKKILLVIIFGNSLCTFFISIVNDVYTLALARFTNGVLIIFYAIYNPIWIDQFVPTTSNSIFMAVHHFEAIIGAVLGFSLTTKLNESTLTWRFSFVIQSIYLGILFIAVFFFNRNYFSRNLIRSKSNIEDEFIYINKKSKIVLSNEYNSYNTLKNEANELNSNSIINHITEEDITIKEKENIIKKKFEEEVENIENNENNENFENYNHEIDLDIRNINLSYILGKLFTNKVNFLISLIYFK